jgi:dihydroxyacetone kinase-like predicted kinase
VLLGERAEAPDRLVAHLAHTHPQVEVQVLDGGQRHYPYLLGVE